MNHQSTRTSAIFVAVVALTMSTAAVSITAIPSDVTPPTINVPTVPAVEATGPDGAVVTFDAPTATDDVDVLVAVSCSHASGSVFGIGTTDVWCDAADAAGNAADSAKLLVTVQDTTPPIMTLPPGETTPATDSTGAFVPFLTSAVDLVEGAIAPICTPTSGSHFPVGPTTVDCSATDVFGNAARGSFQVTVEPLTVIPVPPTLLLPPDHQVPATAPLTFVTAVGQALAFEQDGTLVPVTCDPTAVPVGVATTISCSATGTAGTATGTFLVTAIDVDPPVITASDASSEVNAPHGAYVTYPVSAVDALDPNPTISCTYPSGAFFSLEGSPHTVECRATDAGALRAEVTITVTVTDPVAPAITVPTDVRLEATGPDGAVATFATPDATDLGGIATFDCDANSGDTFPVGQTTVTCVAVDLVANQTLATFLVTVVDTTSPLVTSPDDITTEATSPTGAAVTFAPAIATDLVDVTLIPTCDHASGATFPLGRTKVDCGVADLAGNFGSDTFVITVVDTLTPLITMPADITAEATGPTGAPVVFDLPTATDVVGVETLDCDYASGETFPIGTTTISCYATDAAANLISDVFTITVVDTIAPLLTVPADIIDVEATGPTGASVDFALPTATDLVAGTPAVTCDHAPGATFAVGTTTVSCSASDALANLTTIGSSIPIAQQGTLTATTAFLFTTATILNTTPLGNIGLGSFTVTVVDTTAPVVTVPADTTVEATGPNGASVAFAPATATDLVGVDTLVCGASSGDVFPLGITTVPCAALDAAGNLASDVFTITVVDTTAPLLTVPADIIDVEATGPTGAPVDFTLPTATDLVAGTPAVTCDHAPGDTFAVGTTTVSCSATDALAPLPSKPPFRTTSGTQTSTLGVLTAPIAFLNTPTTLIKTVVPLGNIGLGSFTVTVVDTTAPVVTVPTDTTVEATGPNGAAVVFAPATATDLVGVDTLGCDATSGDVFPLGITTVTCTALDAAANLASDVFTITVVDTTAPVVTVPTDTTVEATGPTGAPVDFTLPTATDLVAGTPAVTCDHAPGDTFALGTTVVTCTASDALTTTTRLLTSTRSLAPLSNIGTASFDVTVVDTTAPALDMPEDGAATATSPTGAVITFAEPTATDLVDSAPSIVCDATSGDVFPIGVTTVTCTATDVSGNSTNDTLRVLVAPEPAEVEPAADPAVDPAAAPDAGDGPEVLGVTIEKAAAAPDVTTPELAAAGIGALHTAAFALWMLALGLLLVQRRRGIA